MHEMPFKLALAQMKPKLGDVGANLEMCLSMIDEAEENGAEVIVFPELALTGYFLRDLVPEVALKRDAGELDELKRASYNIDILIGFVEESPSYHFYISAAYLADGDIKHIHRKVYLPTYGMFDDSRYFARGEYVRSFSGGRIRTGVLICEDAAHPLMDYLLAVDGANIIYILSDSPLRGFGDPHPSSLDNWVDLCKYTASTYGIYVVFVNRVGFEDGVGFAGGSHVVDPRGRVRYKAEELEECLGYAEIDPGLIRRARIIQPLMRDEDIPLMLKELDRIYRER
jgi:NAD+ synthase (glutamine-hydrolysing)